MALTGFISAALSSLKNNARSKRKRLEEPPISVVPTTYDFPTVSEDRKHQVVQKILDRRKGRNRVEKAFYFVILLIIFGILLLFLTYTFLTYFSLT